MTPLPMLPSALTNASAPGESSFRGSMAGLCMPLATLRRHPRGSLLLHHRGLAPPALRRFFRRTVNQDETRRPSGVMIDGGGNVGKRFD